MTNEQLRLQMLSGIITESEYKAKLEESKSTEPKDSLNENFVGMGMIGNIFDREKTDYEMAFEHFLGERYENIKEEDTVEDMEERTAAEVNEEEIEESLNYKEWWSSLSSEEKEEQAKRAGFDFEITSLTRDEIEKIFNNSQKSIYQELNDLIHDYQGNLTDVVDAVYSWIEKNYARIGNEIH